MSDQKYHQALTANRKLLDENARLKAEVERLTVFTTRTIIPNEHLEADLENCRIALRVKYEEVANLKAEVEALKAERELRNAGIDFIISSNNRLLSEVNRLTKAGDAMADALSPFRVKPFPGPYLCDLQKGWEAAKEGKPSV